MSARWLTQILVLVGRLRDIVLHHVLQPVRQSLLLIDRRFGQLVIQVIQRGQELTLVNLLSFRIQALIPWRKCLISLPELI